MNKKSSRAGDSTTAHRKIFIASILSHYKKGGQAVYIDTKNGPVWEPENPANKPLYELLAKHQPILDGSSLFEDLVEVYESLEMNS